MSAHYEIAVFEHQELYYGMNVTDNIIQNYVMMCAKYVNPADVPESDTQFNYGRLFISYSDRSSDDKPMMVMLIGPTFTAQFIEDVRAALKKLYVK